MFNFFLKFQNLAPENLVIISLEAKLDEYLTLLSTNMFICLFLSIFPILIFINALTININILKEKKLRVQMYFIALIIYAIMTPPDLTLQLLILPFLIIFLEFFIYLITFFSILYNKYRIDKKSINL